MLDKDASARYTVEDILSHDWVTANGIQPIALKKHLPVTLEPEDKDKAIGKISALQLIRVRIK